MRLSKVGLWLKAKTLVLLLLLPGNGAVGYHYSQWKPGIRRHSSTGKPKLINDRPITPNFVLPGPGRHYFKQGPLKSRRPVPTQNALYRPTPTYRPQSLLSGPSHVRNKPQPVILPQRKQTPSMTTSNQCPGRQNLIDDIGLLSLVTAVTSSTFGMYTILVNSVTSNNIGIVSGFISLLLWLPSTLLTIFDLGGYPYNHLSNLLNSFSFINSMYGFSGVIFGTADVLASAMGESVGLFSLVLSVIATFPDFFDALLEYLYRVGNRQHLQHFVHNYGCSIPRLFHFFNGKPLYKVVDEFLVNSVKIKTKLPLEKRF